MSTVVERIEDMARRLEDALRVNALGLKLQPDVGPNVDPPAVVVGAPVLHWETYSSLPTSADFPVFVVVSLGDDATSRLLHFVPGVVELLEQADNVVVSSARPGQYRTGEADLPAYQITAETAL